MVREISSLTASVAKLASSMESMLKEQERQGERLEALEGRDGEMWRKVTGYIITAVTGIVLGFIGSCGKQFHMWRHFSGLCYI